MLSSKLRLLRTYKVQRHYVTSFFRVACTIITFGFRKAFRVMKLATKDFTVVAFCSRCCGILYIQNVVLRHLRKQQYFVYDEKVLWLRCQCNFWNVTVCLYYEQLEKCALTPWCLFIGVALFWHWRLHWPTFFLL